MVRSLAIASIVVVLGALSAVGVGAQASGPTIPDVLAKLGKSTNLSGFVGMPSGTPPSIEEILRKTDMIVRGTVEGAKARLSDDERMVYTDYTIGEPAVLYESRMLESPTPGSRPPISFSALGGTVNIAGLTYTLRVDALPPLEVGQTCLFLLKDDKDRYEVAGRYYGVFIISGQDVKALTPVQGFAREYIGQSAAAVAADLVAKRHRLAAGGSGQASNNSSWLRWYLATGSVD